MHHIVADDWCMGILSRELEELYDSFLTGQPPQLPELPIQYADFALWQRDWLQNGILEKQRQYWKHQLAGAPALLELPTDRPRPLGPSFRGAHHTLILPRELRDKLVKLSQREGVTLFMTLLAAFQTLLARHSGQDDIVVGSIIAGRNRVETENLIGHFISTLVLRTSLSGDPTFSELLHRVRDVALGAYAHQETPFEKLVEDLRPERSLSHAPLFQAMFVFQNAPGSDLNLSGLSISREELYKESSPVDLTLEARETPECVSCVFEYKIDLFDATTIARMAERFRLLLERVVDHPRKRISGISFLSEAEQRRLLIDWNNTEREYPRHLCVQRLFEAQVEQTPDALAVVFQDESLTYRELNERANRLAHHLRSLGVEAESLVGICIERSIEMILGVLGILKAGGAYVPLDPNYPRERLDLMLADASLTVVLTQQRLASLFTAFAGTVLRLDAEWEKIAQQSLENLSLLTIPENLAYLIYTSGSTGAPKSVMVAHRSLVNFTTNASNEYELGFGDRVLQFASLNFDTSAEEIFPCLTSGATLVLRTDEMLSSVSQFLRTCHDGGISVLDLPTAYWHEITSELERTEMPMPPALRLVIIGGERALLERLSVWQRTVGSTVRLVNTYGPTEATIVATKWDALLDDSDGPLREVPIGRPLANATVYVLDRNLNPVLIGVTGELHIGGEGLARGYLNRPELTAERFIPNPFSAAPGARLYRSGDLVRYLENGNTEYVGRIDNQVKLRGFRIELGEIEAVLAGHPGVRETVVIAREDEPEQKSLIAYIVAAQESPSAGELRAFLKEKLPEYMIPANFVFLEAMPLTPSGKVNQRALPEPDKPTAGTPFMAPRTPIEEGLAGIWAKVLKLDRVGVHDNFFELGGHSLLATRVMSHVRDAFQTELPLRDIFEAPTVAELAQTISEGKKKGVDVSIPAIRSLPRDPRPLRG
jgi:amino acid adenylation domain-containing protein